MFWSNNKDGKNTKARHLRDLANKDRKATDKDPTRW